MDARQELAEARNEGFCGKHLSEDPNAKADSRPAVKRSLSGAGVPGRPTPVEPVSGNRIPESFVLDVVAARTGIIGTLEDGTAVFRVRKADLPRVNHVLATINSGQIPRIEVTAK